MDGGVLETALIGALVSGGLQVGASLLTKKKQNPVDKGRAGDIRITTAEYGSAIGFLWGVGRFAPNIIYHTPIVHTTQQSPGAGGGKGFLMPKPPTQNEIQHIYTTTLFFLVCAPGGSGSIQNGFNRIWFNNQIVWNTKATSGPTVEAESGVLAGGATLYSNSNFSGGQGVNNLGTGSDTLTVNVPSTGTYELAIFYSNVTENLLNVSVNGGADISVSCPVTGSYNTLAIQTLLVQLNSGNNTIKLYNPGSNAPTIDKIMVAPQLAPDPTSGADSRDFTGIVDPAKGYPPDQRMPWPYYNHTPARSSTGTYSAQLSTWGNPNIRVYTGTSNQPVDPALVSALGSAASAFRDVAYVVVENIQLPNGQIPQVTVECDQGTTAADQIVKDHYTLANVSLAKVDVTALAGLSVPGWLLPDFRQLAQSLEDLQTLFQFDMPMVDGKLKAVLRNGASIVTIPYTDLRAYMDGQQMPDFDAQIDDADEIQLPRKVEVSHLDPSLDYHNNKQYAQRIAGTHNSVGVAQVALPGVMYPTQAKQCAQILLNKAERESRTFQWVTSYKYAYLAPGDVVTLQTQLSTHVVRITEQKISLLGTVTFKGVRQASSIYAPVGVGANPQGYQKPVVPYPGNAKGVVIDGPLLRPEDAGDGSQPVTYVGMSGYGAGTFPGGFMYQEVPYGSGVYKLITSFTQASHIGVSTNALASVNSTDDFDRTNSVTVNFLIPTQLSSVQESDLLNSPGLNLIWAGSSGNGEYLQFATATPLTPDPGYASKYQLSDLLRGRFTTESAVGIHTSSDDVMLIDSTIKPRRFDVSQINGAMNFKFVVSGAALADAPVSPFTLLGNSLKPPTVANVNKLQDAVNDALFYWNRRTRINGALQENIDVPVGEEAAKFQVTFPASVPVRSWQVRTGDFIAMLLEGPTRSDVIQTKWGTFVTTSTYGNKNNVSGNSNAFSLLSVMDAGASIDFTVVRGATGNAQVSIIPWQFDPNNLPVPSFQFVFTFDGTINIYENGTLTTQAINFTPSTATQRFRLMLYGSEVRLYQYPVAPGQVPIYRSALPPTFPFKLWFKTSTGTGGATSQINSIMVGGLTYPATIYAGDQQTKDGLTLANPIRIQLQEIGKGGPGQVLDVTL